MTRGRKPSIYGPGPVLVQLLLDAGYDASEGSPMCEAMDDAGSIERTQSNGYR